METPPDSTLAAGRRRLQRWLLLTVPISVLAFIVLDVVAGTPQTALLTASRAVFLGAYLPAAWVLPRLSDPWVRVLFSGLAVSASLALTLMCFGTGGSASPAFTFMWALPMVIGLFFLDEPLAPLLAGLTLLPGGWVLLHSEGHAPESFAYWLLVTTVSAFIGTSVSFLYRRLHRQELGLEQERADALRRLAESDRQQAQLERLAALGRLASGVTHEVSNPLAYVKSNLAWSRDAVAAGKDPEKIVSALDDALDGTERIEQIVADLRSLGRRGPDTIEACDLRDLVADAMRLCRARLTGIDVQIDLPRSLPEVPVNGTRIVQVLINLLLNAADAVREHRGGAAPQITVTAQAEPECIRVEVCDNGPGLPAELRERLFEPFVTTKEPGAGTGLGLTLSHELVLRHGGTMSAETRPEGGARFVFTLPTWGQAG